MEPIFREEETRQIVEAILCGVHVTIATGPPSTGKSTVTKYLMSEESPIKREGFRVLLVPCDNDSTESSITATLSEQIGVKNSRSFKRLELPEKSVVIFDSFDLIDEAADIFAALEPKFESIQCVFFTRVMPSSIVTGSTVYFTVIFAQYKREQLQELAAKTHQSYGDPEFMKFVRTVVTTSIPFTKNLRDIIYLCHRIGKGENGYSVKPVDIHRELMRMRQQSLSRVTDLPLVCCALLFAGFIASRTSPAADLLRFSRTLSKKKRKKFMEFRDYVALERVIAIARSIGYNHLDIENFDFSLYVSLRRLVDSGLLEIRGDFREDPKVRCCASEMEVSHLAKKCGFDIDVYTTAVGEDA